MRLSIELTRDERFALLAVAQSGTLDARAPVATAARKLLRALEDLGAEPKAPRSSPARSSTPLASTAPRYRVAELVAAAEAEHRGAWSHVLISIGAVRRRLGWPKAAFDRVVLDLARAGHLTLHEHDHPSGVSAEERARMVADAHGRHYLGLVLEESIRAVLDR